jgi:hypothetical protein
VEAGKGPPKGDKILKCHFNSHPTNVVTAVVEALTKTSKTKFNSNGTRRH